MGLGEGGVQDGVPPPPSHMTVMTDKKPTTDTTPPATGTAPVDPTQGETDAAIKGPEQKPGEIGGPKGPEPTRYGDWEFKGRCSDF